MKWKQTVLVVVVLAMLVVASVAQAQFPTPVPAPLDPVDTVNGGIYALDAMGLIPIVGLFVALIVGGYLWRLVRLRGR